MRDVCVCGEELWEHGLTADGYTMPCDNVDICGCTDYEEQEERAKRI